MHLCSHTIDRPELHCGNQGPVSISHQSKQAQDLAVAAQADRALVAQSVAAAQVPEWDWAGVARPVVRKADRPQAALASQSNQARKSAYSTSALRCFAAN